MFMKLLSWLTGGGLKGLAEELRQAYSDKLSAQNDSDRIKAEVEIERIKVELESQREANSVRKATMGQWEMRLIVFTAGFPPALHYAAVCLDSLNWFPMPVVDKLPSPMDEWQGAILLSLFGLSAAKAGLSALSRRK